MGFKRIAVIGNGMVGHRFIEELVALNDDKRYEITVFCEEPRLAYDRVHLSEYFSGKSAEDLSLVTDGFYQQSGIKVMLNCRATYIDTAKKAITTSDGEVFAYDALVMSTGSYPFVPPIPGNERPKCLVYRTIEDLDAIREAASSSKVGVVVGGGLLGLEAAKALADLDLETHVVEFAPHLMAVQLDEGGGEMLKSKIEALGVSVHTSKNTRSIVEGEAHTHRMNFADGGYLETDLIVFSAGIRPRDELARDGGLEVGPRGGIVVDEQCRTSNADVFAIGECALWGGMIFGLVAPGYQMAKVAAQTLAGQEAAFNGADMSTKLKLMGVDVASIGDAHGRTTASKCYTLVDGANGVYKKIVISECEKYLLGAVLVGDSSDYGNLLQIKLNDIELPEFPDTLIVPQRDGGAPAFGVEALPPQAQICSCNNVSKEEICQAIADGACDLAALKACTKAGTTCGGCAPLVGQLLNTELVKLGIEVNNDLCEHFAHTREELYHIIRVEEIKSFDELIEKHGKGYGCEICKPVVASILASCWNDYILKEEHAPLQDTNDYFLANMQKNGTYSVVPRVPGGEITPDKLITIGVVAKKYDLYTKITGGQRIDLFGAQLHQLPDIWRELIDAGFESGHAYGKAMRTVKSCVGSTWCRFGVQDSVGMAIKIEERYRGIRAPHKFKLAVSGCTRECAEAQSKDVGVIATDKGWNLYVCGNGGMKPRHADLFASDLDDDTLIQYIDRFLMFYIKTGARLQRTSVWMDNMEGGLDYLKKVIIDDHLGIGDELEAQMAHLVTTYQCEWKSSIEDPQKLKRFRHFINTDDNDEKVIFVRERGQPRPATLEESEAESVTVSG